MKYEELSAEDVKKVIGDWIQPDGSIRHDAEMLCWEKGSDSFSMDGTITAEQLRAVCWWING